MEEGGSKMPRRLREGRRMSRASERKASDGIALDVALVHAAADHEVAVEATPGGAPAVGNEPVVGGVEGAPAKNPSEGECEWEEA